MKEEVADVHAQWFHRECPALASLLGPLSTLPVGLNHWLAGTGDDWWRNQATLLAETSSDDCSPPSALKIERALAPGLAERKAQARRSIVQADRAAAKLISALGTKPIRDLYAKRLVKTPAPNLPSLFCEIGVCGWLTTIGKLKALSPRTGQRRTETSEETHAEALVEIGGCDVYIEVKRFEDSWESRKKPEKPGRSLLTRDPVSPGTFRPYVMDLRDKLEDAPDQLPLGMPSIVFVIIAQRLPSDMPWLKHALFGEPNQALSSQDGLRAGALFLEDRWQPVSACCRAMILENGDVATPQIFYNPRALVPLPDTARWLLEGTAAKLAVAARI